MRKPLLFVLAAGLALAQTAVFPTGVVTDTDLTIASNRARTTLTAQLSAVATSMSVTSTAVFAVPVLLAVDNEIIKCTAKDASHFSTCTRAFDGTAAAVHQSGSTVSNFIMAHHLNQMKEEVKALEQVLSGQLGMSNLRLHSATSSPLYQWHFNDTVQGAGIFTMFGQNGGPYIHGANPVTDGPGNGEYHFYWHASGSSSSLGAIGKSVAWQSYLDAGNGGTLSGLWIDVTAGGDWEPQVGVGGITNGPIGATFSATMANQVAGGGYALSMNTYATCNGPFPCSQISGYELDVTNNVVGTGGHVGMMVVDQSSQPTTQAGGDFAYGLAKAASAPGFKEGINFNGGLATNATIFLADNASVQNGIDFSGVTFSGLILNLPGFVLGPGGSLSTPLTIGAGAASQDLTVTGEKTSGAMIGLTHGISNWASGNGLQMNFATGGGSFSGLFEAFMIDSVVKWSIDATGTPTSPALKATTGTRFVCVDTAGKFVSSASACSGT